MSNELYHYGIPGMKWGVRRYQNADGSLTRAGMDRYGIRSNLDRFRNMSGEDFRNLAGQVGSNAGRLARNAARGIGNRIGDTYRNSEKLAGVRNTVSKVSKEASRYKDAASKKIKPAMDKARSSAARVREKMKTPEFKQNAKKVAIVGGAVIATAAAAYGGYKLSQLLKGRAYDKAYAAAKAWLNKGVDKAVLSQPASRVHGYRNEVERVAKKLANDASKNFKSVITANMGKYDPMKNGIVKEWNPANINIWAEAVKYLDYETAPSYLRDFL